MKSFNTIGYDEALAATNVIESGILSGYVGTDPLGGAYCRELEFEWARTFGSVHAIAVNSATSGLLAACMAIELKVGDEVIVSPYTMSATAAAPKILGANIVFADIDPEFFCIDPASVIEKITSKTKAVIATNLFGHPARLKDLRELCNSVGVYLIEDNAQGIFSRENHSYAGTIGDIGVFSLNVHKHLQVGEGGVCVTNSTELARKLREAMNHGELRGGILGLNLRMTEVTAAMARAQLMKAKDIMVGRLRLAEHISFEVTRCGLPIQIPHVRDGCQHAFYCWAGKLTRPYIRLIPPFKAGYQRPLYELEAFKQNIKLPVTEAVQNTLVLVEICSIDPSDRQIRQMVAELAEVI